MIKTLFYEVLARLGFWIPCDKYMPNPKYWDWVMISFYEPGVVCRYIPDIAEYSHKTKQWHSNNDDVCHDENLNNRYRVTHWHKIPSDRHLKIKNS